MIKILYSDSNPPILLTFNDHDPRNTCVKAAIDVHILSKTAAIAVWV